MRTMSILHRLFPAASVPAGAMMMSILFTAGCQDKFDLATLPQQVDVLVDTSYVELEPPFTGFTRPEDLMIGNDQLLYVADTKGDRVVMLNRAGQVLSTRRMQRPIALAQDSRLDLLVGGRSRWPTATPPARFSACIWYPPPLIPLTGLTYRLLTRSG